MQTPCERGWLFKTPLGFCEVRLYIRRSPPVSPQQAEAFCAATCPKCNQKPLQREPNMHKLNVGFPHEPFSRFLKSTLLFPSVQAESKKKYLHQKTRKLFNHAEASKSLLAFAGHKATVNIQRVASTYNRSRWPFWWRAPYGARKKRCTSFRVRIFLSA